MKNLIKSLISQITHSGTEHSEIGEFQNIIGYHFKNVNLLLAALTHTSREQAKELSSAFERMEFLGDSILGLVVAEELFQDYPDFTEGKLSKLKSKIVSRKMLALCAAKIQLKEYIIFNIESIGKGGMNSILSNTMESLICAIYLDGNITNVRIFIIEFIMKEATNYLEKGHLVDYKSKLQEFTQVDFHSTPDYYILKSEGPAHEKVFTIQVKIDDQIYGLGKGPNKKAAQQDAAKKACNKLGL
ncbi:MAG: ribonuclease III [Candidatus Cloacimonetes bacterium]|nr:ribonuclease III [Candidatus Cloacimonadota bacterium]